MSEYSLNTIEEALSDLKKGKVVIVVDDEDRENEGDFIAAAEKCTPEMINFMVTHGRGLLCAPLTKKRCEELSLNMMVENNTVLHNTQFTVSVDLIGNGCTTGISAEDRSKTMQALVDDSIKAHDLGRPGHIFPLKARDGGVLRRAGHTEAAVDLARMAGFKPAGLIVEILNEDGSMARLPQLVELAKIHDLKIISIEDLIEYRLHTEAIVTRVEEIDANLQLGDFKLIVYNQTTNNQMHFALVKGEWTEDEEVLVRVKATDAYYNMFSSLLNGEQPMMQKVINRIEKEGKGAIIFVNNVMDKDSIMGDIQAFKDVIEKKTKYFKLGTDSKDYGIGSQIIKDLGIRKIRVISRSKSPFKREQLLGYGIEITGYESLD